MLLQPLTPTTTLVGAQPVPRTEASNHLVEAMVRQVEEAAGEETAPGTATPESVDNVAKEKEKERKEEDEGGGQVAGLPMMTVIGQRTGTRTSTSSLMVAEVVAVLVPETLCWRFSRG